MPAKIVRNYRILNKLIAAFLAVIVVFNSVSVAIAATWTQSTWDGGSGTSTTNQFSSSSSVTTSVADQATLTPASNWYNSSWKYRKKITLNNTDAVLGVTAETLTNFPVLVKLTSSNFDFSKALSTGNDIRFTDSDGTTLLTGYQIESWSTASSQAFVWVKVPSIDTTGTDSIYIYYGNSGATDAQSATAVWDSNYKGVWHLKETGNGTAGEYKDSTSNANNGRGGNGTASKVPTLTSSAQINGGQTFGDGDDYIVLPTLSYNNDVTFSAWIKGSTQTASDWNYWIQDGTGAIKLEFGIFGTSSSGSFKDNSATGFPIVSGGPVTDNNWHYVTGVISGTTMIFYLDGVLKQSRTDYPGGQTHNGIHIIGGDGVARGWNGSIDEVRISTTGRSAAWTAAEYFSQKTSDSFNSYASEEAQVATSGTLTSAIFDAGASYDWITMSYSITTPSNTSGSVKVRSGNQSDLSDATTFSSCTAITSGANLSTGGCVTNGHRYVQYQVSLANTDATSTPTFSDISVNYELTAPSSLSGSPVSSSSINWSWTDNSGAESGFYIQDTSGNTKCTVSAAGTTTCTETGLTPNTSYTRRVVAYNASGNSSASSNASAITLSTSPTTSNITSNRSTSTWYNTSSFTFTNGIGFGAGGVEYLRYVWDTSSTHTWSGSETQWTASTLTQTATSEGNSWYLHLKGYNSNNTENGTLDFGSFYYDGTNPNSVSLESPSDSIYTSSSRPTFRWKANSTPDATSGLSKYQVYVKNSNGQYVLIDNIPVSGTADVINNQYIVQYSGFNDSDSDNNYVLVYTKSSSSWNNFGNDGKLKEGTNTWGVTAVDNAGNGASSERTIYADYTNPSLSSVSVDNLGEKDGYVITSDLKPTVIGTIVDNLAPNSVQFDFYKQNFFLGVETSQELALSTTYSLNNTKNNTTINFNFAPSQTLEYGKYQLVVTGIDKTGNKSATQTISVQILTTQQANQLLYEEIKKDGLAQQTTPTVSLVELEKKAILRREKEASQLAIAINDFKNQFVYFSDVSGNLLKSSQSYLALSFLNLSKQVSVVKDDLDNVIDNGKYIVSAVGNTASNFNSALDASGNRLRESINEQNKSILSANWIPASAGMTLLRKASDINSQINNSFSSLVLSANEFSGNVVTVAVRINSNLDSSSDNVKSKISLNQTNLSKSILKASKGIVDTNQMIVGQGNNIVLFINTQLASAQQNAQKQIVISNETTTRRLSNAGEAISVAARSIIKPAVETRNFADRVAKGAKIAFSTFGAYVFDESPTRISNVTIEEIGKDYIVLSWETNHYTRSNKVNYGDSLAYGNEIWSKDGEKNHQVRIEGLTPGKRYFFEVMGQNKNYVYDAYYSFETVGKDDQ